MRLVIAFLFGVCSGVSAFAQETYDLIDYELPPGDWQKKATNDSLVYIWNDPAKGYCILSLYRSAASKGIADADAQADWSEHVIKRYPDITNPKKNSQAIEGSQWVQVQSTGTVLKNNQSILVSLITFSGYDRRMSILFENNNTFFDSSLVTLSSSLAIHPVQSIPPK